MMALPARRFLKSRRVNFLASTDASGDTPHLLRGTYQSPILIQWKPAEKQIRHIDIQLTELY